MLEDIHFRNIAREYDIPIIDEDDKPVCGSFMRVKTGDYYHVVPAILKGMEYKERNYF